jgi:putative oxidoreductase
MLMLSAPQRDLVRDKGTKFGRMLIGLLFLAGGLSMLLIQGPANVAMYFDSLGIPLAGLAVWLVIVVKVLAGLAIVVGYRVGLASAALIVFVAAATITAHSDFSDSNQITATLKNLAIIGGLLYLMAYGPGGTNTTEFSTK